MQALSVASKKSAENHGSGNEDVGWLDFEKADLDFGDFWALPGCFQIPATTKRCTRLGRVGGTFDPSPVRPRVSLASEASSDARASAVQRRKVSAADLQYEVRIFG